MTQQTDQHIPCSLYIHLPWCVKKCPYCDFNSHELKSALPETAYLAALQQDLRNNLPLIQQRSLCSIFIGGGTPSLFTATTIAKILATVYQHCHVAKNIEITLEANPGTLSATQLTGYLAAGINRLSIGLQSTNNKQLQLLGRIHDSQTAINNLKTAQDIGFNNINVDLMYGLPQQTLADALLDLSQVVALNTTHLSWYQLTIEPNTVFYHSQPILPADDTIWAMQTAGQQIISNAGLQQYEISAYAQPGHMCQHNLNYWQFGDYLGIGAGAHSKITNQNTGQIKRYWQVKNPQAYLSKQQQFTTTPTPAEIIFEFMLNHCRLNSSLSLTTFRQRTGLDPALLDQPLNQAVKLGLITYQSNIITITEFGKKFVNDLIALFL
jgi:oxygen-independent coproporphyrinogen-3 oxidase